VTGAHGVPRSHRGGQFRDAEAGDVATWAVEPCDRDALFSPKSANALHLLQNMRLNRVEDFFIADVGQSFPGLGRMILTRD
jgi:hypothetical protein